MKIEKLKKSYFLLLLFLLMQSASFAGTHMNFLPMEDNFYTFRNETAYGASIETIKPFRETLMVSPEAVTTGFSLGSTDILIFIFLLVIYFGFTHKKSQTRNIDI